MGNHEEIQLLVLLKGTVEGLLVSQVANVWSIYGGLNRLYSTVERIFKHGYRIFSQDGEPDLWVFINGLSWLQPNLATSPTLILDSCKELVHIPPHISNDKSLMWIYKSLENHSLSQKLAWLLSDREHLLSCYEETAFLAQEQFAEAALICLRAVEHNRASLLTEINPCLYMNKWNPKVTKTHRRCSSFPETLERINLWTTTRAKPSQKTTMGIIESHYEEKADMEISQAIEAIEYSSHEPLGSSVIPEKKETSLNTDHPSVSIDNNDSCEPKEAVNNICLDKVKPWSSLPSLLGIGFEGEPQDRNLTNRDKHLLLNRSASCRARTKRSGSQTVPSSPFRSSTAQASAPIDIVKPTDDSSQASANVLRVDYSELQQRTPDTNPSRNFQLKKSILHRQLNKEVNSGILKSKSNSKDKAPHATTQALPIEVKRPTNLNIPSRIVSYNSGKLRGKEHKSPSEVSTAFNTLKRKPASTSNLAQLSGSRPQTPSRKSFMEDGGSSVQPMSTGYFPQPAEGQSLTSFLSSGQFSRTSAELDRENAHFSISEAMIAAMEQMQCNRHLRSTDPDDIREESDEEINHLKQRLRFRRQQRQVEQRRHLWGISLLSDGRTDTTTTDQSVSPLSTSPGSASESISTDDVEDMELDEAESLTALKGTGLSASLASLYTEAELSKHSLTRSKESTLSESVLSAEGVALSLLRKFSDKQLPKASDLKWLVSEQEVPQVLLPLPKSWPVSPDEAEEDMKQATPLRGNLEWAPPRPQIIFTIHPSPVRRILMAKQSYRCAGCGMKVAPAYAHRFRYCEYLGRFFCTGCHSNHLALIPGRVLTKWDFTRYPVSSFSFRLLDQMFEDPLFRVSDHNPTLYRKSRSLERCRQLRLQLFYLKDLLLSCRFAEGLQEALQREPSYMVSEDDLYSMHDLEQVKSNDLSARLQKLVTLGTEHVSKCLLCLGRGFLCELCSSEKPIFLWQLGSVTRCSTCGACYHTRCFQRRKTSCQRCIRLSERRKSSDLNSEDEGETPPSSK